MKKALLIIIPLIVIAATLFWWFFGYRLKGPAAIKESLTISQPQTNETVGLPLVIKGQAVLTDNFFKYRLLKSDGSVLVQGIGALKDEADGSNINISIAYPEPGSDSGQLEVFSPSGNLGSPKVVIPIKFSAVESQALQIYFSNALRNPQMLDCGLVYPVTRRLDKTQAPARAAIEQLLQGTSLEDISNGFFSNINPGTKLNNITIDNGVAKVDFDEELQFQVGGSCRVTAIRAQIEQTLKQFSTVTEVVISVNGNSEEALQP